MVWENGGDWREASIESCGNVSRGVLTLVAYLHEVSLHQNLYVKVLLRRFFQMDAVASAAAQFSFTTLDLYEHI